MAADTAEAGVASDGSDWLEALEAQLDDEAGGGRLDPEAMRAALEGHTVPAHLRAKIWKVLMGVRTKPDMLTGEAALNAEHECPLKADCRIQSGRYAGDKAAEMAEEMEAIINHFCRVRGVEYSSESGLTEMLAPFAALPMTRSDRYNCFYAFMSKYALKDSTRQSAAFHVFRLLLLYHDPEVCAFLDTVNVTPEKYSQSWFRGMFAALCGPQVILSLWDSYLLAADPFFVFFLALVMLVNARDYIFSLGDTPDDLIHVLSTMPRELSPEDVPDMCELAFHYTNITPQSFRNEFGGVIFRHQTANKKSRAAMSNAAEVIRHTLCLHVPSATLLRQGSDYGGKQLLIDCRTLAEFDYGHLPRAWHLDAQLMMDKPALFQEELARLEEALDTTGQHPCFMGSGREEDDVNLSTLVAKFLQRNRKFVTIVHGGFKALHAELDMQALVVTALDGHSSDRCRVCLQTEADLLGDAGSDAGTSAGAGGGLDAASSSSGRASPTPSPKPSRWRRFKGEASPTPSASSSPATTPSKEAWSNRFSAWSTALKEKKASAKAALKEKSAAYSAAIKAKATEVSSKIKQTTESAFTSGNTGDQVYRPKDLNTSVFAIDDTDEEEEDDRGDQHSSGRGGGADLDLAGAVKRRTTSGELVVDVDLVPRQAPVLHTFQCNELLRDGHMLPSYLVLTRTHVLKLRLRNAARSDAVVLARRPLTSVLKITSKKKHPTLLTFVFEDLDSPLHRRPTPPPAAAAPAAPPPAVPEPAAPAPDEPDSHFAIDDESSAEPSPEKPVRPAPPAEPAEPASSGTGGSAPPQQPAEADRPAVPTIRERFLVPEAADAKIAFRDLTQHARDLLAVADLVPPAAASSGPAPSA